MPNNNSWNGIDTGNKGSHYAFRTVSKEIADRLDGKNYYYNFGDGWGAGITVKKVDKKEANKIRKESRGFCGYDWMIDSIIYKGKIVSSL